MSGRSSGREGPPAGPATCTWCGRSVTRPRVPGRPHAECDDCRQGRRPPLADGAAAKFSRLLREGMATQGYTLRSLVRRVVELGGSISVAGLGAWVNGKSLPANPWESATLRSLEIALEYELGDLTMILTSPDPTPDTLPRQAPLPDRPVTDFAGRPGSTSLQTAAAQQEEWIRRVTAAQPLLPQTVSTSYRIGSDGRPHSSTTRMTVRALARCDCYWFRHAFTAGGKPVVEDLDGCEKGRTVNDFHPDLEAVELTFPRRIPRGERHTFSFRTTYSYGGAADLEEKKFYARAFHGPISAATLEIVFDAAPSQLWECTWPLDDIRVGHEVDRRPVELAAGKSSISLRPPGLRAYGWGWQW
jgi:hypothetical protein